MASPIAPPNGPCGATIACSSPTPRSRTGSRPGGKKAVRRVEAGHLDWALADFSGYIAADELYDGPFCILSIVDNRTFKRLAYGVPQSLEQERTLSRAGRQIVTVLWVTQRPQFTLSNAVGQRERIAPQDIDVLVAQR